MKPMLSLTGNFRDNMVAMINDLQIVLKISRADPLLNEKTEVKQIFKGNGFKDKNNIIYSDFLCKFSQIGVF
ncbi:hypothetical protein ACP8HI_10400 [Paenibacillus sp. FA6]|uniref:hypothetical protein n=1 Tax=Paenibacillus sp. FA6 TaxID=3413029 RepID=UPI003F65C014